MSLASSGNNKMKRFTSLLKAAKPSNMVLDIGVNKFSMR